MCVLLIKRLLRLVGRWARKPVNHTSWVAVVTPTDRPKSVRNRCVIELFCDVVYVVILPFWQFCWCRGFCHRTESDLFLFLSISKIIPIYILFFKFYSFIYFLGEYFWYENDTHSYTWRPEKHTPSSRTSVYTFIMEVTPPPMILTDYGHILVQSNWRPTLDDQSDWHLSSNWHGLPDYKFNCPSSRQSIGYDI